ncbi:MAG: arylsulfatase [Acidimicrobiia bacterium]|nr:MAG: arylsulfatase [Acidimicrobiia bacterium]
MEPGEFQGVIGRYHWESKPWWPEPVRPPAGAPNVLMIVLDDVGFAQLGCFGSDLDTPVFDGLAARGLRYRNFHTTALCSPTRACLLTGRNHHSNGMGRIIDLATGFPGYDARIPKANPLLPEMLVPHGYAAWAVGKWHLTAEEECHLAARRDRWPLGRGFERFYGFFPGEVHQYAPALVHDNHFVDPPASIAEGYHLTEDLVDHAITFVRDLRHVDVEKPFFCYFATGACHSPHHAPREWIDRYRGRFDEGWDVWRERTFARQIEAGLLPPTTRLSERPDWVPAWTELSGDERRVYARYMEAFAGFLSHTDHHVGRLLDALAETGDLENTIVVLASDNGASSEGGPKGSVNDARAWNGAPRTVEEALAHLDEIGGPRWHNNYPWGWTVAGNTPFRRWKREVHEGGVADPLIVSWPRHVPDPGGIRHQYVHAIDVVPTLLELIGIADDPRAQGVEGVSFAETLRDAEAPDRHTVQYYEMFACRALYQDGWKAVVYHPIQTEEPGIDVAEWELYHVAEDPAETVDLAAQEPERLEAMVQRWWEEAERYNVLPLDNRPYAEFVLERPGAARDREHYVYWPGTGMVSEEAAVNLKNRDHVITAYVDGPGEGVLCSQGSRLGGWTLFVRDGRVSYVHDVAAWKQYRVDGECRLGPGPHTITFRFEKTGEHRGTGVLLVDGVEVGRGGIELTTPMRYSITGVGLWCGRGGNLAVCDDYEGPFAWTGTLRRVEVDVRGAPFVDPEAEAEIAIRTQ